jgi:mannose/cellobiose epimerase-like protein (N-acyl-D-glucosamine 2-epimerase family)
MRDPWVVRQHLLGVLNFYHPNCIDRRHGGYVAQLDERDGHVYDGATKHLVATCRGVFNFSLGAVRGGPDWCRPAAEHGLRFLLDAHRDRERGGFDWLLEGRTPVDSTRYCYGHAFALLACAKATEAGIPGSGTALAETYDLLVRFWEDDHGLFRAEATPDWEFAAYRGQNANMHACEALLAAYEATGEDRYLDRAYAIAAALARDLAAETDGRIWEHFTPDWEPDLAYNRDRPRHQFRPWGFQPGHHAEWAKLLCLLAAHREEDWLVERARELFAYAVEEGWDDDRGGFYYALDEAGEPVVADKYGWAVAEAIGAAAALARETGDESYWRWYDECWTYAREHLVNPKYGNWYEKLSPDNERDDDREGPAVEPGYHPVNNAAVAIDALER